MFMNWSELLAWIRSNQANNYNVNTISAFAATMGWKHRLLPLENGNSGLSCFIFGNRVTVFFTTTPHLPLQLFSTLLIGRLRTLSLQESIESSLGRH